MFYGVRKLFPLSSNPPNMFLVIFFRLIMKTQSVGGNLKGTLNIFEFHILEIFMLKLNWEYSLGLSRM